MSPSAATTLLILSPPADVLLTAGSPHGLLKPSCSSFAPAVISGIGTNDNNNNNKMTNGNHNTTTNGYFAESCSFMKYHTTPDKTKLLYSGIGGGNNIQSGLMKADGKPPKSSSTLFSSVTSSMTKNTKPFHHHHFHLPSPPLSSTLLEGTCSPRKHNKTTNQDDGGFLSSSPTMKNKIPSFYHNQQQRQDCLYNMMSIPPSLPHITTSSSPSVLPPNTSPILKEGRQQRRFSISSMTTTNRPLRDLATDHHPNLINNDSIDQLTLSSSYDKQQRKKNRNSLCHLPSSSSSVTTNPVAITTAIDYHKQKEQLRFSSSSRLIPNDETINQTTSTDNASNNNDDESSSSLFILETNKPISTIDNIQTRTTSIPKQIPLNDDVFPLSKLQQGQSPEYKIRTVSTEYDDDVVVVAITKQHKKRRQSSIGIPDEKQRSTGKHKRRSMDCSPSHHLPFTNSVDRYAIADRAATADRVATADRSAATTATAQEGKRIPTQPILHESKTNELIDDNGFSSSSSSSSSHTSDHPQQQEQQQPRRRLFPKLPDSDIKQIAPILCNTRKLIHEYTRQLNSNNNNNNKCSSEKSNHNDTPANILTQISSLTGYVVTPPVYEINKDNSKSDSSDKMQLHQRMELWNRVGPALKQTEKFKNETAAAVEEVTQTRIEKAHNNKYQYYNLKHNHSHKNSKKHNKLIDPKDYEARYNVMLEEVTAIRSSCWNKYFDELQIYIMNQKLKKQSRFPLIVKKTKKDNDDNVDHRGTVVLEQQHNHTTTATHMSQQQHQLKKTVAEELDSSTTKTNKNNNVPSPYDSRQMEISKKVETKTYDDDDILMGNSSHTDAVSSDVQSSSPMSLDTDAYRSAKNLVELDTDIVVKTEQQHLDDDQQIEDDHNLLLAILPSRDLPSSLSDDPEIAQAEKQLWKELDEALDRYSQNVMNIMNKRK